jgi:ABC-type antimicrobial peptide transport system permease subunit
MGSNRLQLFAQMIGETAFIVGVSGLLAAAITWVSLPPILEILSIQEPLAVLSRENVLLLFSVMTGCVVLAGFYPAIVLSGFEPVMALKNRLANGKAGGLSLRRALVVLQFTISQALIIGTIVAITQMDYVRNADLGFNKEAVMVLGANKDSASLSRLKPFKSELLRIPGVRMVSLNSDAPSSDNNWGTNFAFDHKNDEDFILYLKFADRDYFKTFDLKFISGEPYRDDDTTTGVVVNENLMKQLGIKSASELIGKDLRLGGGRWKRIVGVVNDFKTNSLREDIKPVMIAAKGHYHDRVAIKLHSQNIAATKKEIEKRWEEFFPEYAFFSFFVDESIERFYQQENRLAFLFKIFAGLAIFISCLGLYGLVSFMVVQKTREVGIRKVLGAGVSNIIFLFSKEFTILIVIAFVIACPLAYYIMKGWLDNFVFRIELGLWIFAVAALGSLLLAWCAVGYKAVKAAVTNPVKSLRTE